MTKSRQIFCRKNRVTAISCRPGGTPTLVMPLCYTHTNYHTPKLTTLHPHPQNSSFPRLVHLTN